MYSRKDKSPRLVTPGFEHLNNFVLFDDGRDVFIKRIDNDESLTTNLVQFSKTPLCSDCSHYTMTIQELTDGEFVMFGITNKCVPGNPMWIIDRSVRYHSNDGGVFNGGLGIKTYHPYTIGDRITCKLDYTGPDRSLVNFLKNDRLVYRQWVNLPPGQLYPTIGVSRTEAKLKVDWPTPGQTEISIRKELPSNWFGWTGLHRDDETKTVSLAEPDAEMERSAYNIQCPEVLSKDFSYFEIEIVNKAEKQGCQAIGLVAGNCEPFVMPGWTNKSIGYHNDDGGLYCDGNDKTEEDTGDKKCGQGDIMGCGIIFPPIEEFHFREPILVLVYFTLNGKIVYKKRMRQPRGGFFPCVGFLAKDDSCKLNVDAKPPTEGADELIASLNSADVTADFRCSEVIQFKELAPDSAVFSLTTESDEAQLVQYLRYPLSNVGDGFYLEVLDMRPNTELQVGVSIADHKMEGNFLGSNSTSCGYLFKLGSLAMQEGMRPVKKWAGLKETITCYLDFQDERLAVLCFENGSGEMIGRTTVTRADVKSPLYASVVMSSGPCIVRMNWSRSIYNTHNVDRSWGHADQWLRPPGIKAHQNKLTLETAESYSFAACCQCRQPMLTGSSYFSIRLLDGESLPGIGLSKSTTDVSTVLGSDKGEVCFLPSTGELLLENNKWVLQEPPIFKKGDILQCGMIFAEQDRVEQKGVVFFALNDQPFFHCRFHMVHGGAYPTIAFSSAGCSAELLETNRSQPIPEGVASEWLNEDKMVGAAPYKAPIDHIASNGYTFEKASYGTGNDGDLTVVESTNPQKIIYVSHTVRESDRVNPFITALRKHFLTCTFETSSLCVEMRDKKDSIARCEFVILFMSDIYSESHEMAMEYSLFEGKTVLVAAHSEMHWPPGHYFKDERKKMERCPMVKVSTSDDSACVQALIKLVDAKMQETDKNKPLSANGTKSHKKSGKTNSGGNSPHGKSPSKDSNSSSSCHIL